VSGSKAVISADDYRRLYEAAGSAFKPFLKGLWLTGCRPGELSGMTAAMVDWTNGVVLLTDHKTAHKTGKARAVFLSPEALELFKMQADRYPSGPLFRRRSHGKPYTVATVQKAMHHARTKAGLPHAIAYGFRHAFATDALSRGVPDATVAALLGHSGTAMLHRHYSHLTSRAAVLRDAAKLVRG
jgi:integrase